LPTSNRLGWNLERLARSKHSSLLRKYVNRGQKSFLTLGPGLIFSRWLVVQARRGTVKQRCCCLTSKVDLEFEKKGLSHFVNLPFRQSFCGMNGGISASCENVGLATLKSCRTLDMKHFYILKRRNIL
jgi:hypothetical protein